MSYSIDTRTLKPGDIFIPVKGPNFDGHDFIDEAKRKGASKIIDVNLGEFAREHRSNFNIPLIAVTGSAGKTTVKDMLAAVLGQKFKLIKSEENQNNEIGVPLTLLKIEPQHEMAIVEMAMRGLGQIEYLAKIAEPTHAVITNIGYTHIELLQTREAIALAKSEVIRKGMKVFLNKQDDYYDYLCNQAEAKKAIVYEFNYDSITEANAAAVTAVALEFGLTEKEIVKGLKSFKGSAHRQIILDSKQFKGVTIIDDAYNSNPDGLAYALQVLKEKPGRKIAVIGDMKELGKLGIELHKAVKTTGIDLVITYGDLAKNIKNDFNFAEDEKGDLIKKLKEIIKSGDVILVKGSRSMKMEDVVDQLK